MNSYMHEICANTSGIQIYKLLITVKSVKNLKDLNDLLISTSYLALISLL